MHIGMLTDKEHLGQLRIKMSKKWKTQDKTCFFITQIQIISTVVNIWNKLSNIRDISYSNIYSRKYFIDDFEIVGVLKVIYFVNLFMIVSINKCVGFIWIL